MRINLRLQFAALSIVFMTMISLSAGYGFHTAWLGFDAFGGVVVGEKQAVAIREGQAEFKTQVQEWKDTLLRGSDPAALAKHWGGFEKREANVDRIAESILASAGDAQTIDLLHRFVDAHRAMGVAYRKGLDQFKTAGFDSKVGDAAVKGIDREPNELLSKAADRILAVADDQEKTADARARKGVVTAAWIMIAITVLSLFSTNVLVGLRIVSPTAKITAFLSGLENGRFDGVVGVHARNDEIGILAKSSEALRLSLKASAEKEKAFQEAQQEAIRQRKDELRRLAIEFESVVGEVADNVLDDAEKMEVVAQSLSAMADQTSRQSAIVASSSEQTGGSVQTIAAAAEELSASIKEIGQQMERSLDVALTATDEAAHASRAVDGLTDMSEQIGSVTKMIKSIADQTRMLALNASIEAARAGIAGKGFAVVANEVKTLSAQTATAADEITARIGSIQSVMTETATAISAIVDRIGDIKEISTSIAASVEQQSAATSEIARNVQQAAIGADEVVSNIVGVTKAAEDTDMGAGEVLSSSRRLVDRSKNLQHQVRLFTEHVKAA